MTEMAQNNNNGSTAKNVDIPVEELQNSLRKKFKSPELKIVDVDIFRPDDIVGNNFGSYARHLTVRYAKSASSKETSVLNLFAKTMGESEFHETMEAGCKICERECEVLTVIQPALKELAGVLDLDAITPACYYADKRTTVLENLEHSGFRMRLVQQPQDMAHVKLVVSALAEYHAASYALKKCLAPTLITDKYPILKEAIYAEENRDGFGAMIEKACTGMIEGCSVDPSTADLADKLKKVQPHLFTLAGKTVREEEPFNVICHGDPWSNNMMFKYDQNGAPREIKLIDFQIGRYAPAVTDIIYYLYSSTTCELRRKNLETILRYYYSHFVVSIAALGVDGCDFTYEQFRKNYHDRLPYSLIITNMFGFARNMPKTAVPDIEGMKSMSDLEESFKDSSNFQMPPEVFGKIMADFTMTFEDVETQLSDFLNTVS